MITSEGKNIVAKYLLGQAPEFAGYLAVGTGYAPLSPNDVSPLLSSTATPVAYTQNSAYDYAYPPKSLAFEVFRVPITSKGLVKDADGIEKMVFKAQLPVDQTYQITEMGIYPSEYNTLSSTNRSRMLFNFTNSENWTYSNGNESNSVQKTTATDFSGIATYSIIEADKFDNVFSKNIGESLRFLNMSIATKGNSSTIGNAPSFTISNGSWALENKGTLINLGKALPDDAIKLALCLIGGGSLPSGGLKIVVQLINSKTAQKAQWNKYLLSSFFNTSSLPGNTKQSRYKVVNMKISEFTADSNFSWSAIDSIKIYTSVVDSSPSSYSVLFDGMRFEDLTTKNPLYGLVGLDIIRTDNGYPITKLSNSSSFVEYRFGIDI